ncbi:MAG: hypothetical protein ABMA64_05255 [Myxococcota bacterium]
MVLVVGGFAAWAGDAELEVERGRVAFELEQYRVARDRALEALSADPSLGSAQQLYLDATTAGGYGSRGLFELVGFEPGVPPSAGAVLALDRAVEAGRWTAVRDATAALMAEWPQAPDLLRPLWDSSDRRVVRLRQRFVRVAAAPATLAAAPIESLYRLRRLVVETGGGEARAVIEQQLTDRGESAPPGRPPLDRLARIDLALQLSKEPVPVVPSGYPSESYEVATHLEQPLATARRYRHVALAWQQVQQVSDRSGAWTNEAAAWLAEGSLDKAAVVADEAVLQACRSRHEDLGALNRERQRQELAAAYLVRAKVSERKGEPTRAWSEYATAVVLAGGSVDDPLGERLEEASRAAAQGLLATYGDAAPAERALAEARKATDPAVVATITADARFLATWGQRRVLADAVDVYAELLGTSFRILAEAERDVGRIEQARAAIVTATVLTGEAHPRWWALRGELQDRSGETDAAFASWSVARGLGVRGLDVDLGRVYLGPSGWTVAADNLGGAPPVNEAPPERSSPPPVQVAAARFSPDRPSSAPRIGRPFPAFAVDTGYGPLTERSFAGRVAIVVFWEASCRECLQMLPAFGGLARRLRQEGRDVLLVGIGLDEDRESFDRVAVRGADWAQLAWAPGLRGSFAVENVPTAWVVDTDGIARYYVDHWLSVEELEGYVRDLE